MTDWAAYITKIETAMLRGEKVVEHDGKRVEFRGIDEALKAIAYAKAQQAAAANAETASTQSYVEFWRD